MPQVTEQGDQSAHTETSHTAAPQSHFKENISVLKSFRNLLKSKKNVTKSGVPDVRLTLSFDLYFISVWPQFFLPSLDSIFDVGFYNLFVDFLLFTQTVQLRQQIVFSRFRS